MLGMIIILYYLLFIVQDEIVAYGLLRRTNQFDESLTVKFVFVYWVGEKIDRMHRARLGTHKGAIEEFFAVSYFIIILK
jgi:hypothetical protein